MIDEGRRLAADSGKALRVMTALDATARWVRALGQDAPIRRVPLEVSYGARAALQTLEDDLYDFLDEDVKASHAETLTALAVLCETMDSHLFPDHEQPSILVLPPEWKERDPDRYYGVGRELAQARTAFFERRRLLANLMNSKGLLSHPDQIAAEGARYVQYFITNFGGTVAQGQNVVQTIGADGDRLLDLFGSDEFKAGLAAHFASAFATGPKPSVEAGQGSERRLDFIHAHALLPHGDGAWSAADEVTWQGPAEVQRFTTTGPVPGWMLYALPGRPVVAVAEQIWAAVHAAGSLDGRGDPFSAVGFPVPHEGFSTVGEDETDVLLTGGHWSKKGRLVRPSAQSERWKWAPEPALGSEKIRAFDQWSPGLALSPRLRVRVVASVPWVVEDLEVTADSRRYIEAALPPSHLAGALTAISRKSRRGEQTPSWRKSPDWNDERFASYAWAANELLLPSTLAAQVMLGLPYQLQSDVTACAELFVEGSEMGIDETEGALRNDSVLPLSVADLLEYFLAAWQTVIDVLLRAVAVEPGEVALRGAPCVGLQVVADHLPSLGETARQLADLVDLSSFGPGGRRTEQLREMFITVSAPLDLTADERRRWARQALVKMARIYGFTEASEGAF